MEKDPNDENNESNSDSDADDQMGETKSDSDQLDKQIWDSDEELEDETDS